MAVDVKGVRTGSHVTTYETKETAENARLKVIITTSFDSDHATYCMISVNPGSAYAQPTYTAAQIEAVHDAITKAVKNKIGEGI